MKLVKNKRTGAINVTIFQQNSGEHVLQDTVISKLIDKKRYGIHVERYCTDVKEIYIQLNPKESVTEDTRTQVAELVKLCNKEDVTDISISVIHHKGYEQTIFAVVDGLYYGSYDFDKYKSEKKRKELNVFIERDSYIPLKQVINLNIAQRYARNLVNTPGSDLTPDKYMDTIQNFFSVDNLKKHFSDVIFEDRSYETDVKPDPDAFGIQVNSVVLVPRHIFTLPNGTIEVEYLTTAALEGQGYTGINAVGKGSINGTGMVSLTWRPNEPVHGDHYAFVGKGVTFDTGGISLKPGDDMWEMKMDMGGSAAALGAFIATVLNGTPVKTSAILCLAENRPGDNSLLPGDIFTAANGKTIMVDNTDAEGRLVLTDGLYKAGKMGATHIADIATLTGAVVASLGDKIAGVFSDDTEMVGGFINKAIKSGEKYWRLPLASEYREGLDDDCADICNMGGRPGAITAALFLKEFVPEGVKWMHVDIAGPAMASKKWKYYGKGGTGFGVRALFLLPFNEVK